jgi:hypothetical protein
MQLFFNGETKYGWGHLKNFLSGTTGPEKVQICMKAGIS